VGRELGLPDRSSLLLARPFLDRGPGPGQQLDRGDLVRRVRQALAELSETDREVLLMRNVDELPYQEIGCILDLAPPAARKRYGRALLRLRAVLLDAGLLGDQA
jgi:RNA polymerase sigma-70 factor (ECF subfamily)